MQASWISIDTLGTFDSSRTILQAHTRKAKAVYGTDFTRAATGVILITASEVDLLD
jgi:hypothetical protein